MGALHASVVPLCRGASGALCPAGHRREIRSRDWSPLAIRLALWLLALLVLAWPHTLLAQTTVTGPIEANTRWALSGSPYLVRDNLFINGGATLTIDAGVTVYVAPAARVQVVSGSIVALGTAAQPIVIASDKVRLGQAPQAGDWGPWLFTSGTTASRLEHVKLQHGKGMVLEAASPTLNHVEWQSHQGAALTIDLQSSPVGVGLKAVGCGVNGIVVPAGDLTGSVKWALRGIPYVVQGGKLSVGASPRLSSVSPASVERGQTVTLTVNGARLGGMSAPTFNQPGLPLTPFSGGSASQVFLQLKVADDAPLGAAALRMQVDAGEVELLNAITVTPPLPAITALSPTTVFAGAGVTTLTVQGRNFTNQSEVLVNAAALPTTWVSAAELRASLPSQVTTGALTVQVRTPDAQSAGAYLTSGTTSLQVQAPVPPVLAIEPTPVALPPDGRPRELVLRLSKADYRDNTINLSVSDSSKASVSPASILIPAGQTSVKFTVTPGTNPATLSLVAESANLARVSVPLFLTADFRGANTSYAQPVGVVVTVVPGQVTRTTQLSNQLVGVSVGAVLTQASPRAWTVGGNAVLSVQGRGLAAGTQVAIEPAAGLTLGAVTVAPDGSGLSVPLGTAANAAVGSRRLVIKDAAGKLLTFADPAQAVVQVMAGLPVIDAIEPITAVRGSAINLLVRGRNLHEGRVVLSPAAGLAVDAQPEVSADGTTLTARLNIAPDAESGPRVVQVVAPAGATSTLALPGNTLTIGQALRPAVTPVTSPVVGVVVGSATRTPDPVVRQLGAGLVGVMSGTGVSGLSPRTGVVGTEVVVQVTGSGLAAVNAVRFVPEAGLSVVSGPTVSADGKRLSFTVKVDAAAALGLRRLVLQTAAGLPVTFSQPLDAAFLVSAPIPELQSVTPTILVSGQPAVRMLVRGVNLNNVSAVRVEPAEGMTVSGPFEVDAEGRSLGFTLSAAAGAASGQRVLVVTTPAGESTATLQAGNLVRVAAQLGNTVPAIASPIVGVVVGSASGPARPDVDTTLSSRQVGVVVGSPVATPDPLPRGAFSLPVGVSRGPVARAIEPRGFLQGASGSLVVTGSGLGSVTSVSIKPDTGILLGTPTVSADQGSLSVSISVAPDAPLTLRELKLLTADGPIVFADAGTTRTVGIGKVPTLTSISPILIERGKGVTLSIRGTGLAGVTGAVFSPASGLSAAPEMTWSQDALGELLTLSVGAASTAELGERALILLVPGGQTGSALTPANTLKVIAPQ